MKKIRPPIRLWGSKEWMAPRIIDLLPPHQTYVEVFGGTGAVLLAKEPSPVEVFNDINSGCTTFYRVLRNHPEELQRCLVLTPYSREEYEQAKVGWRTEHNEIERARQWFVVANTSFGGKWGRGFSTAVTRSRRGMAGTVSAWLSKIEGLSIVHERLRCVQIECLDFGDLIPRYDSPATCFYCDPPYVTSEREPNVYQHEFSNADHEDLVARLLAIKGTAIVSGYDHPIYHPLDRAGWQRHEVFHTLASGPVRGKRRTITEILWVK